MRFTPLPLAGAFTVAPEPHADERGFFARTVCETTFEAHGLVGRFAQSSISFNARRGTVRGMHYAVEPHAETKLVRCTGGAIHDVIVDLRPTSTTFLQAIGVALTAAEHTALYVPAGFAHGFQTLADDTEVLYMIDRGFEPSAARGLRWDDPAIDVQWPESIRVISDRDRTFPDWSRES